MRVKWLRDALAGLILETEYIAAEDPATAGLMVIKIVESVERLAQHPASGRPGRVAGTRELVVTGTPFVIPYRVIGKTVEVIRVFHGARKWPTEF